MKFFSSKYSFYKEKNYSNKNILLIDRHRFDATILASMLALAANKKYKMNIMILSDLEPNNIIIKIYKHLGFKKFLNGVTRLNYLKNFNLYFYSIIISIITIFKIMNRGFSWFIKNFNIKDIPFGDLIYDTNVRFNHRYVNPKIDLYFIKLLIRSIFRILLICKYLKKYNIKKLITSTENYSLNSGLAIRIAIYKSIKHCFTGRANSGDLEIANLTKKGLLIGHDNIKNEEIFKKFKRFNPSNKKINQFYNDRKIKSNKSFSWTLDSFNNANKKSIPGNNFLNKLSKSKSKKILFAAHAFSDAPHQKGINYTFNDFYNQFEETISFVNKKDPNNIWIFRSHPSSLLFNEQHIFKRIIKKYKMKNILFCPSGVPIKKLYEICDIVVTGSGTVGLEFICEGKPAILAGSSGYSTKNLTPYYAKDKNKYFNFIKNIKKLKKPNKTQILLAKKILFFFESGNYIVKRIETKDVLEDKICKEFFLKKWGQGSSLNNYLILSRSVLKQDIYKSRVFNQMSNLS